MSKMTFDDFMTKKAQRDAARLKVGELSVLSGMTLEARMPSPQAVLELYGELAAAADAHAAMRCGNHALYAVCPQLQDRELQKEIGTAEDPMSTIDALFSLMEQDKLGEQALQFVGLLPSVPVDAEDDDQQGDTALDTVKN